MPKTTRGAFTLIELLVVIAVIAVLVALIIANLNATRARARDATRKSDLANIQTGLEIYADTNNHYPQACSYSLGESSALYPCSNAALNLLKTYQTSMQVNTWREDPSCENDGTACGTFTDTVTGLQGTYKYGYNTEPAGSINKLAETYVLGCSLETGDEKNIAWGYKIGPAKTIKPNH
jgi:prepilin-type N-terminal cleavage/methylation domain-containing protein